MVRGSPLHPGSLGQGSVRTRRFALPPCGRKGADRPFVVSRTRVCQRGPRSGTRPPFISRGG
eukprot:15466816-Alexandrium_andersonii.AAC.1